MAFFVSDFLRLGFEVGDSADFMVVAGFFGSFASFGSFTFLGFGGALIIVAFLELETVVQFESSGNRRWLVLYSQ